MTGVSYETETELLNLLNEVEEKILFPPTILTNLLTRTGARMQDSIYHMPLKSNLIRDFHFKTSRFRRFLWASTHNVTRLFTYLIH